MSKTNRWLTDAVAVSILILAGMAAATQTFAYLLGYHADLGVRWGTLYRPWEILVWYARWKGAGLQAQFMKSASVGLVCSALGLLGFLWYSINRANTAKADETIHGSARWAERNDIEKASLIGKEGVYVGAVYGRHRLFRKRLQYLRHNGPEHVLCYAPTRSGKGVGLVIPTLLSWPHSAVVTDLKGELWALTSGWRKEHAENLVLRFEPAAHGSVKWNPLDEIRTDRGKIVGDVQNLANLIVDPDGRGLVDHWQKTSWALLTGVMLYMLYRREKDGTEASLAELDRILSDPKKPAAELWQDMIDFRDGHPDVLRNITGTGRDMADRPENEAGSVLSTAKSYLSLYRDPVVSDNTGTSEFSISDLMHHDRAVTLYIVTAPTDKGRLRPLVRVLVNMIVRILAEKLEFEKGRPVAKYKHRLLLMMDEFASLGKLEIMQESLAYLAGYGIKAYLILQDIGQLKSEKSGYGADESISSNCHVQCAFPPNRIETAEHLSKLTGTTTIVKRQISESGGRTSVTLGHASHTMQEIQRPLMTPDETMRMKGPIKDKDGTIKEPGEMLIFCAGFPAVRGVQPLYFQDPVFDRRAEIEAPEVTDRTAENEGEKATDS